MLDLFKHKYDQVVEKIKLTLKPLGNRTAVIYNLLTQMSQGDQSFDVWYRKVNKQANSIDWTGYNAKKVSVDAALVMQTSSNKL